VSNLGWAHSLLKPVSVEDVSIFLLANRLTEQGSLLKQIGRLTTRFEADGPEAESR
jgi:hypothetical protein